MRRGTCEPGRDNETSRDCPGPLPAAPPREWEPGPPACPADPEKAASTVAVKLGDGSTVRAPQPTTEGQSFNHVSCKFAFWAQVTLQ